MATWFVGFSREPHPGNVDQERFGKAFIQFSKRGFVHGDSVQIIWMCMQMYIIGKKYRDA